MWLVASRMPEKISPLVMLQGAIAECGRHQGGMDISKPPIDPRRVAPKLPDWTVEAQRGEEDLPPQHHPRGDGPNATPGMQPDNDDLCHVRMAFIFFYLFFFINI